jgi:hypothetical protein
MDTIKEILVCKGNGNNYEYVNIDFSPYWVNWFASVGALPSGVIKLQDALTGSVVAFGYKYSALANGVTSITITVKKGTSSGDVVGQWVIKFNKTACADIQDICCDSDALEIRWLSREGGIKSFKFNGVREFSYDVGDALRFKSFNSVAQYSQRKDIYKAKRLTTGDVSKTQLEYLSELKYSIQAWEGTTPILLNNESFKEYGTKDKFFDVSISYILANEIKIQTQ